MQHIEVLGSNIRIVIGGKTVSVGQTEQSVIETFGEPDRVVTSDFWRSFHYSFSSTRVTISFDSYNRGFVTRVAVHPPICPTQRDWFF